MKVKPSINKVQQQWAPISDAELIVWAARISSGEVQIQWGDDDETDEDIIFVCCDNSEDFRQEWGIKKP